MHLAPSEDEARIADEAGKILADLAPLSRLHRGGSPELSIEARKALADSGWFALNLAESANGSGMSEIELALFFREAGRHCASVDVLAQSLAVLLVADRPELRNPLVTGERSVALLIADAKTTRVLGNPGGWALEVRPRSASLVDLGGLPVDPLPSLDPVVSMGRLKGEPAVLLHCTGEALWRKGQLAVAAMLVGITETALSLLVDYAKVRQTFGKPIGAYQAVRHPCAEIAVRLEAARSQLWFAAAAMKEAHAHAHGHVDAAKHLANESAAFATDLNIHLHGGIGVTDEHDAHILMKHALLLRKLFGTRRSLLAQLLHASFGAA